jgi:uncharacterized protein YndB with AHSA1/START domain
VFQAFTKSEHLMQWWGPKGFAWVSAKLDLRSEQQGRTTLTLRGGPINANESERKAFDASHELMEQGFKGTFDQLADYLAKQPIGDRS